MEKKLNVVLQRMDSKQLSKLWLFYRDYFQNDEGCLNFLFSAVKKEPVYSNEEQKKLFFKAYETEGYVDPNDSLFIPHRMLNCVERMVSAARDMEQIRQGKDVFKVVFLVSCAETLQKLSGKGGFKKDLLLDFFENNTSVKDKNYIRKHFAHGSQGMYPNEDSFWQFVSVLSAYRNAAAHEGAYEQDCFKNYSGKKPLAVMVRTNLANGLPNAEHIFETTLSYQKFNEIFVRTCISFIKNYVSNQEATHAHT